MEFIFLLLGLLLGYQFFLVFVQERWIRKTDVPLVIVNGMEFVYEAAGTFEMGCSAAEESACDEEIEATTSSKIIRGYMITKNPVTKEAYRKFKNLSSEKQAVNAPVIGLTWFEAESFCAALETELPTEAQWESAIRRGGSVVPSEVSEWTADRYAAYPKFTDRSPRIDPQGPDSGSLRVVRAGTKAGGWHRFGVSPEDATRGIGFRCVGWQDLSGH